MKKKKKKKIQRLSNASFDITKNKEIKKKKKQTSCQHIMAIKYNTFSLKEKIKYQGVSYSAPLYYKSLSHSFRAP